MVLAAAARAHMSLDCLGHGMTQNEPGVLARGACPILPRPSVEATFTDFLVFKDCFLVKKS